MNMFLNNHVILMFVYVELYSTWSIFGKASDICLVIQVGMQSCTLIYRQLLGQIVGNPL